MSFKSITKVSEDYMAETKIHSGIYHTNLSKKEYTTPLGLVTVSLSGCVSMCVRSYYKKILKIQVPIEIENVFSDNIFNIKIIIDKTLNDTEKNEILKFIKNNCTVSKMLNSEVKVNYSFVQNV